MALKLFEIYLRPLCKNKYAINDTLSFADMIKRSPPLPYDEEYVSYYLVSFTNIPLDETIDHIRESIYTHKKRPQQICSKLVFRRLEKVTKDCTAQFCFKFL